MQKEAAVAIERNSGNAEQKNCSLRAMRRVRHALVPN